MIMLKRIAFYTLCALSLAATSCKSDFIEQSPVLNPDEAGLFSSEARLATGIEGVYARAKNQYFLGGFATLAGDNRSDDMMNVGGNGYTMRDTYNHNVNAAGLENDYMYNNAYLAINYANTMIDNIETHYADQLPCDAETAKKYVQECKFVRALSYYYLSQLFGQPYKYNKEALNVPLRIKAVTGPGENDCPQATVAQVFEQILKDTEDVSALPETAVTKASKAAAHALRMRVYMCMDEWKKAIDEGDQITGFQLVDISKMFGPVDANTDENIFSIPMSDSDKSGSQSHPVSFMSPSYGDITVVNNINGIATVYGVDADARTKFIEKGKSNWYCVKYTDDLRLEWIPIFRYAEVLLNYAECYYRLGNEPKAIEYLKQVRTRSIAAGDDTLVNYAESGAALWTAIDNERRWEFLGEGLRGYDISRRAEDYRHPQTDGSWFVIATPDDHTTYCWAFPEYEKVVNGSIQ